MPANVSIAVLVFGVCALICAAGHAAILRSVIRSRAVPTASNVPRPKLVAEIFWALVPVLALALVLTATWDRIHARELRKNPPLIMKVAQ